MRAALGDVCECRGIHSNALSSWQEFGCKENTFGQSSDLRGAIRPSGGVDETFQRELFTQAPAQLVLLGTALAEAEPR